MRKLPFIFPAYLILSALGFNPSSMAASPSFPEGFKWCVATSAHQIEGGNIHNDWWEWEQQSGRIKNGDRSGRACDHWNLVPLDISLMKWLGVTQYRMSVEWARIEPEQGQYDFAALEHYRREIDLLILSGIEPMITLQHFTLPAWLRHQGGWAAPNAPQAFEKFAELIYRRVGSGVQDWITINEPMVTIAAGYLGGVHPPGIKDPQAAVTPLVGMIRAHAKAYRVLHQQARALGVPVRVGVAHHLRVFEPYKSGRLLDRVAAKALERTFNWALFDTLINGKLKLKIPFTLNIEREIPEARDTQDFIGVNYYSRDLVDFTLSSQNKFELRVPAGAAKNDLGWEIYPQGLRRVLDSAHKRLPNLPIVITENGTADHRDSFRPKFLRDHLQVLGQAIADGVPVEGYCHWSLLDNFEWAEGFEPRFGLFEVNYQTMARTPRASALLYREYTQQ